MTNKFNLTFGNLIAHLIPGLILLLSIIIIIFDNEELLKFINDNTAITITLGFFLSLACGLILDAIRYLIFLIPRLNESYRKWCDYDVSKADDDGRKFHDWIIDHYFRFHQFYGNLCLSLFISTATANIKTKLTICQLWPLYLVSVILAIAACFTFKRTISTLTDKFPKS